MTTNVKAFTAALANERKQLVPDAFVEKHRETHRILNRELQDPSRLPVDTGRFRASYETTIGSPSTKSLPSDLPFYPIPGADDVDRVLEGLKFGEQTFITNNASSDGGKTSYAEALDNGHSPQAQEIARPAIQATKARMR